MQSLCTCNQRERPCSAAKGGVSVHCDKDARERLKGDSFDTGASASLRNEPAYKPNP